MVMLLRLMDGLVSRLRSLYLYAGILFCELRNRDTSKLIELVWLWCRGPHDEIAAKNDADF
jgi:hypothetical protein